MKESSDNALISITNLLKQIRYFKEEYYVCNPLFMTQERERYIWLMRLVSFFFYEEVTVYSWCWVQ